MKCEIVTCYEAQTELLFEEFLCGCHDKVLFVILTINKNFRKVSKTTKIADLFSKLPANVRQAENVAQISE